MTTWTPPNRRGSPRSLRSRASMASMRSARTIDTSSTMSRLHSLIDAAEPPGVGEVCGVEHVRLEPEERMDGLRLGVERGDPGRRDRRLPLAAGTCLEVLHEPRLAGAGAADDEERRHPGIDGGQRFGDAGRGLVGLVRRECRRLRPRCGGAEFAESSCFCRRRGWLHGCLFSATANCELRIMEAACGGHATNTRFRCDHISLPYLRSVWPGV